MINFLSITKTHEERDKDAFAAKFVGSGNRRYFQHKGRRYPVTPHQELRFIAAYDAMLDERRRSFYRDIIVSVVLTCTSLAAYVAAVQGWLMSLVPDAVFPMVNKLIWAQPFYALCITAFFLHRRTEKCVNAMTQEVVDRIGYTPMQTESSEYWGKFAVNAAALLVFFYGYVWM